MMTIAQSLPGFISYKVYANDDGERVSIHEWKSAEHLRAWSKQPEHVLVQIAGREKYYSEYTIYALDNPRESNFIRESK